MGGLVVVVYGASTGGACPVDPIQDPVRPVRPVVRLPLEEETCLVLHACEPGLGERPLGLVLVVRLFDDKVTGSDKLLWVRLSRGRVEGRVRRPSILNTPH